MQICKTTLATFGFGGREKIADVVPDYYGSSGDNSEN
jgi:hypothetical protein